MPGQSFSVYLRAFGEETRRARQAHGLSREEVARRAGIHENTIGALERGERDLNCISQMRLLSALGCGKLHVSEDGVCFSLEPIPAPTYLQQLTGAHAANIVRIMGAFIRCRRKELGLNLEEASREAGIHRNSLWNFERGLVAPNGYSVFALFHALGLSTARADFLDPQAEELDHPKDASHRVDTPITAAAPQPLLIPRHPSHRHRG